MTREHKSPVQSPRRFPMATQLLASMEWLMENIWLHSSTELTSGNLRLEG